MRLSRSRFSRRVLPFATVATLGAVWPAVPSAHPAPSQAPGVQSPERSPERIVLTAGRSRVMSSAFDVVRIAVTNPAVADATLVEPRQILVDGRAPGTVSLIVWGAAERLQYDVVVEPARSTLQEQLAAIFPGEDIRVGATDEVIVLTGRVSAAEVALRAAEIAQASSSKLRVVNMLQRPGAPDTQQVMLEVRFAEVNRNAMMELGANLLAERTSFSARTTTQQFPAPSRNDKERPGFIDVPDYLNLFLSFNREGFLATIKALQQRGQFQSLAEPNLIAYNGQEASFLAGGEFPIPVVQGGAGLNSVTVQFKEFGVRLKFRPTIVGETIRLKVRPEVSTLDFTNGLKLSGFTVPALTSRWAETEVELGDGQTFAIAGLLNNMSQDVRSGVPLMSSLPIVGSLFKSKSEASQRTELLVLITPHLVRPLEPAEVPPLPVDSRRFIRPESGPGGALEGGGGLVDAPVVSAPKP